MPTNKKDKGIPVENSNNFYKAGWQPNAEFSNETNTGEITHVGTDPNYARNFDKILEQWQFDPKEYEICNKCDFELSNSLLPDYKQ